MPQFTPPCLFVQQIFAECLPGFAGCPGAEGELWWGVDGDAPPRLCPEAPNLSSLAPKLFCLPHWPEVSREPHTSPLPHPRLQVWNGEPVYHEVLEPDLRQKEPLLNVPSSVDKLPTRREPPFLPQFKFPRENLTGPAGVTCSLLMQSALAMGGCGPTVQKELEDNNEMNRHPNSFATIVKGTALSPPPSTLISLSGSLTRKCPNNRPVKSEIQGTQRTL